MSADQKTQLKTLLLGLLLGNTAGLMLFCSTYPKACRFLEAAFPYGAGGYYASDFSLMITVAFGLLIFPAVPALMASRLYCLWSLLPLSIFFLWLVAGSGIAHRLNSLFDPSWIFPFLFLGAWAISSFPISLFRWVRSRRRPAVTAARKPVPRFKRYLTPALAVPLLLLLLFVGWHNLKYPEPLSADVRLSWDKDKEAVVPLTVKNGGIYVMASLSGEEHLCQIDTGSDDVNWVRDLHLVGKMTQERSEPCDALNNCVVADVVKLPEIRIGSYKVTDLPTDMLDSKSGLFSPVPRPDIDAEPLLGNALFSFTVLTIDYQNKKLIIRPATYDFTKMPRLPGDRIVQMGWINQTEDSSERQQVFGWPAIPARVCGKSFWCIVDTGWSDPKLVITSDLYTHLPFLQKLPKHLTTINAAYSSASVPQLDHLSFQVPALPPHSQPITLQGEGTIIKPLGVAQGIVGTKLMERYRITIDYQRRWILLEPYQAVKNTQKQEKQRPVAKLLAL